MGRSNSSKLKLGLLVKLGLKSFGLIGVLKSMALIKSKEGIRKQTKT
jgi:hypothetical protein